MKIYRKVLELLDGDHQVALLLVVGATGSTPQRLGAKALVDTRGTLLAGTIGGGLMESRALARGAHVLKEGVAELLEFSMDEAYSRDAGPICGGTMRILAAPCRAHMRSGYGEALVASEARRTGLLITTLTGDEAGHARWLSADGVGDDVDRFQPFLDDGRPGTLRVDREACELFVEPVRPPPQMLIVGGGHVGQAVAQQAAWLGFNVLVVDDRPDFAQADRFPAGVRVACGSIRDQVERFPKDGDSYIVLVSKGHKPDAEALERCIHDEPAYIGMIGSRRKISLLRSHFVASGLATEQQFARVFAPIGLDIGAVTVEEIATSIVAQIVSVRRNRSTGRTAKPGSAP